MANKIKGVVELTYDGQNYKMVLDFNALAEFEDAANIESAIEFIKDEKNLNNARTLRLLFWCGLKQFTPDMPIELAGKILSANLGKLGEALGAVFPNQEPSDEEAAGNPLPARHQTQGKKRRR